jgi:hypothetical protein
VGVQEVIWDGCGTEPSGKYTISTDRKMRMRGRWCEIIVLKVHALTEDKIDDMKNKFYEELEYVFDKFPKYHMKI